MRRQECVVRVVGISGSVADDTVVVVLAVEVWPPMETSHNSFPVYRKCRCFKNVSTAFQYRVWRNSIHWFWSFYLQAETHDQFMDMSSATFVSNVSEVHEIQISYLNKAYFYVDNLFYEYEF
jgi:hypothetical protein